MSFTIITSSYQVGRRRNGWIREAARVGVLSGVAGLAFALVGAYATMDRRFVVEDTLTLAQAIMGCIGLAAGALGARVVGPERGGARRLGLAVLAGGLAGLIVGLLPPLVLAVNLRPWLVSASPALARALSFGCPLGSFAALGAAVGLGALCGLVGGWPVLLVAPLRRAVLVGAAVALGAGLFRDVFASVMGNLPGASAVEPVIFGSAGINPGAAMVLLVLATAIDFTVNQWKRRRPASRAAQRRSTVAVAALVVFVLLLPLITDGFVAQVLMLVALYTLMGMGLNIELGLAGLVDLGFVAFFAVGAYTVALLCSSTSIAVAHLSFWVALPLAVLFSAVTGLLFGLPVLRVRGDYLAMATLGLGEIVRILVLSDALSQTLGGSQGIIEVARPKLGPLVLNTPTSLYYLALALAALVALISWRLQHSKVGRAWLAIRQDEDVAQALGVDLVAGKLTAYTIGAAFAGAAGAVFAVLIGSVFPQSFQLLVSINVLAILVIGGLGSLPGVLVGALALIGLPELLREFGEYRYLFYGLALVAVMHLKSGGLWPAASEGRGRGA